MTKNGLTGILDNYFKFNILFLIFLLLVFDRDMALIYIAIIFGDYIWYKSDKFISFKISNGRNSLFQSTIIGLAALGFFLGISTLILKTFSPQSLTETGIIGSVQGVFQLLSTSTPFLQGSKVLTFIGWGIMIPIIETSFFNGRLLEGFATYAENVTGKKIPLDRITQPLLVVFFIVAALFTLLHITAKALDSTALVLTFMFSIISSYLVIKYKQLREAIIFHISVNSVAVAISLGWIKAI